MLRIAASERERMRAHKLARDRRRRQARVPVFPYFPRLSEDRYVLRARMSLCSRSRPRQHQTVRGAMRSAAASVSNRNGAPACRNRIFLHRHHHILVVETFRTRASARESRRESSDSAYANRLGVRCRAASSALRSRLADWLCRRSTSSPDPRTSPTCRASFSPAPPCRDWPR
jgi:hypothetical protein